LTKMPSERSLYLTAGLLEAGVVVLFCGLVLRAAWALAGGILILAGLVSFGAQLAGTLGSRRRHPRRVPGVDYAVLHSAAAGVWLAVACGLGLYLLVAAPSDLALRVALAYGVFGLIGFLSQMVVAMKVTLLPLLAWYHAVAAGVPVKPPHAMADRRLLHVSFLCWVFAVPALAVGLAINGVPLISAAAWTLFAALQLGALSDAIVMGQSVRSFAQSTAKSPGRFG
jgi:hypothetical protein